MKKMNNKGFAISTLLYGLMLVAFLVVSLLMSVMATNRKNTSTLIRKIEEELNRYSQTTIEFTSTDGAQEFIVPYGKAGWYKIELWGAAAINADASVDTNNEKGGYTSGVVYLEENTHLYFYIGTKGGTAGNRNNTNSNNGGGATDVRLVGGNWNSEAGLSSRIMVAGGGGQNSSHKGTGYTSGYNKGHNGNTYISGYGPESSHETYGFINTNLVQGVNAGDGKARIELVSTNSKANPPTKKNTYLENVRYIKDCITGTNTATTGGERWVEIQAFDSNGQNVAFGKSAINELSTDRGMSTGDSIPGITDEKREMITTNYTRGATRKCVLVDLGDVYNLEEIVIFHAKDNPTDDYIKYSGESIGVSANNIIYQTLRQWTNSNMAAVESSHGIRFSARDPEGIASDSIAPGNYFIDNQQSVYTVITAQGDNAVLAYNTGEKTQRWSISPTGDGYYYIVEAENSKALQSSNGAQEAGETLGANTTYKKHQWEEWNIIGLNNGFYQIQSRANPSLCIGGENDSMGLLKMYECNSTARRQWFRLINADY